MSVYIEKNPTAVLYDGRTDLAIIANPKAARCIVRQCEKAGLDTIADWLDWQESLEDGTEDENPTYLLFDVQVYKTC